jgi:lactoylglutathione lyase
MGSMTADDDVIFEPRPTTPRWTHVALRVADMDASIAWFETFTPLRLITRREDEDGYGAWLGHPEPSEHPFILVLAHFFPHRDPFAGAGFNYLDPFAHLGIEMPSREDVDAAAALGEVAGCLRFPAQQMPAPIGYICMLADPDGNLIEFSFNQGVYAITREVWGGGDSG